MNFNRGILVNEGFFRGISRKISYRILMWAENINNADLKTNGESYFLEKLLYGRDSFTFFDVGANVGDYAVSVLGFLPHAEVHLFEPSPDCSEVLKKKLAAMSNVNLNECACSDSEGSAVLWFDKPGSSLSSLYKRDLKEYSADLSFSMEVKTLPLESYILAHSITCIDLLKIDVEGHEKNVLAGLGKYLSPDYVTCIQFEYGGCYLDSRTSLRDIYRILEPAGYDVCKIMPNGLLPLSYQSTMDNFQYANYVAVPARGL